MIKSIISNRGWAKFHREQWNHWVSDDKPFCRGYAWTYLWSNANHKDNEILMNGRPIKVMRGELVTSIVKLANIWRWGRKKVSNFLNYLEKSGMMEQERTSEYTLVRIVNYESYQGDDEKRNRKRISKEHQRNTNNNDKNEKKVIRNPLTDII